MMIVRPVRGNDRDALLELGRLAGHGMTTVPKSLDQINHRIDQSARAFASKGKATGDHIFYMVLEEDGKVIGTCCIFPNLGEKRPFYSYRVSHLTTQAEKINVRSETDILMLVNDYHGYTEVGTLYLHPDSRGGGRGRLLSFARFMLMALEPERFSENVMAEIRGWSDEKDIFPFYEHIARKFFGISFVEADKRSAHEHQFIADLMPKYPVYTALLPKAAKDIVGKPHDTSKAAMDLLYSQGFRYENMIDIFDGGPSVETRLENVDVVKQAQRRKVVIGAAAKSGSKALISTNAIRNFACMQGLIAKDGDTVTLSKEQANSLGVAEGDLVLTSILKGKNG